MKYLSSFKNKNLSGKTCLLRVDFNINNTDLHGYEHGLTRIVPLRILSVLPTVKFLIDRGAKVVILSHRGRPDSKSYKLKAKSYTLKPFTKILSKLLKKQVKFIDFNFGTSDVLNIKNSIPGSIFILENLRFNPAEEKNDKKFAKKLASLGDFYVNDAFSVSHRVNASVAAITEFLASYAGLALEAELKNLNKAMKNPKKPLVIILGGAKISDKIGIINNFSKKADKFLIGGGIANTFFAAQKIPIGDSLYEKEMIETAKKLLKLSSVTLPVDTIIYQNKILDIGPKTIQKYAEIIKKAGTIVWNGPMGYIENPKFSKGSNAVMKAILQSRAFSAPRPKGRGGGQKGLAIIGGGETIASLKIKNQKRPSGDSSKTKIKNKVFLSTGGGAMLEYLAGKKLPGIKALN